MAKKTQIIVADTAAERMAACVRLLRRANGATGEEMRLVLNRVWAPTQAQLRPIADRTGFILTLDRDVSPMRYRFETEAEWAAYRAAQKPAPKAADKPAKKAA